MEQMAIMKSVVHCDKPTNNYHQTLQFSSALRENFSIFQLFCFVVFSPQLL